MQLFVLILVLAIFGHDFLSHPDADPWPIGWGWAAVVILPKLLAAIGYALLCRSTLETLPSGGGPAALKRQHAATTAYRLIVIAGHYVDLWWVNTLGMLRVALGDLVFIDEMLILTPPILMMAWSWWAYYPIDHRLRQAVLLRQIDTGLPVHPIWTRPQYMIAQLRHQVVAMLVPLGLLLCWTELIDRFAPSHWLIYGADARPLILVAGCGGLLLAAPVMIRHIWDTTPLPDGQLRDELTQMCKLYRVGVRQLLLWRTHGALINAAVMGLVAPLRYILLTDALLERLEREQVEAVMAHELAHICEHHMFWLMAAAGGSFAAISVGWAIVFDAAMGAMGIPVDGAAGVGIAGAGWLTTRDALALATGVATIACWALLFGWVSRRFERQADTFAVTHLARVEAWRSDNVKSGTIDEQSVRVMTNALTSVADLNHLSTKRHSWRHGSIAWRQSYLRTLVGQSSSDLPIDRQLYAIKLATAVALVGLMLFEGPIPTWFEQLILGGIG